MLSSVLIAVGDVVKLEIVRTSSDGSFVGANMTIRQSTNTAPVLPGQADRTNAELTQLVVTNTATDTDLPANVLTYVFLANPTGATLDATGIIR